LLFCQNFYTLGAIPQPQNMLAIKLKRIGKRKQAAFRVIVAEKKSKVHGRYVDDLGSYSPHTKVLSVNKDRAVFWIGRGAQPTATVHNLLVKNGVISGAKIPVHKRIPARNNAEAGTPAA